MQKFERNICVKSRLNTSEVRVGKTSRIKQGETTRWKIQREEKRGKR